VSRISVDDYLHPPEVRYARGRESAEGCYRDTADLTAFRRAVEQPVAGLLVADGVFLQRPELADLWDLVVLLVIDDDEAVRRARHRDPGDPDEVERLYRTRYLPAQQLYRAECAPTSRADVVIDNTDPANPVVLRRPG
jgi:uridine kinase